MAGLCLTPATSTGLLDLAGEVAGWGGTMATAPRVPGTVLSTGSDAVPMNCNVTDSLQIVPQGVGNFQRICSACFLGSSVLSCMVLVYPHAVSTG